MAKIILRATIILAALATGWAVASAQMPEPDFELVVDAPVGSTTITCVKGCSLMWVERGINPRSHAMPEFSFSCRGGDVTRCSSRKVGGWITR